MICRYVYDYIGGDHDKIFKELLATICTFAITTLWLGPCELVYIWSFFNCFGLNFELWVAKFFSIPPFSTIEVRDKTGHSPLGKRATCHGAWHPQYFSGCLQRLIGEAMSRRIRGVFNAANYWAIVLYNILALNNLDFAKLVARRLIVKGR